MRALFFALLVLAAGSGHGVVVDISQCDDGQYVRDGEPCPTNVDNYALAAVTDTTVTVSYDADIADGTAYLYVSTSVAPPGCGIGQAPIACLDRAEFTSPTSAACSANASSTAGTSITLQATSCPDGTNLYAHFAIISPPTTYGRMSLPTSVAAVTPPTGEPPPAPDPQDLSGTGFFITKHSDCSDTGSGLSARAAGGSARPWCGAGKISNVLFPAGSKFYFESGYTWTPNEVMHIITPGVSWANPTKISCFKMSGGVPVACDQGTGTAAQILAQGKDPRPIFKGGASRAAMLDGTEDYTDLSGGCGGNIWNGLFFIQNDNIHLDYIEISDVKCRAIRINGNVAGGTLNAGYVTGYRESNVYIHHIGFGNDRIRMFDAVIKDHVARYTGMCEGAEVNGADPARLPAPNGLGTNCGSGGVSGGPLTANTSQYVLFETFDVRGIWGEPAAGGKSRGVIHRNGKISNACSSSVYYDACERCLSENITLAGANESLTAAECGMPSPGDRFKGDFAGGIEVSADHLGVGLNYIRRNSVTVGTGVCFEHTWAADEIYNLRGAARAYGITCVDPVDNRGLRDAVNTYDSPDDKDQYDLMEYRGNIIDAASFGAELCDVTGYPNQKMNGNKWSQTPDVSACIGADDPDVGSPVYANKPDKFNNGTDLGDFPYVADDVKTRGQQSGDQTLYGEVLAANFTDWFSQRMWDEMRPAGYPNWTQENYMKKLYWDINGNVRPKNGISAGAHQAQNLFVSHDKRYFIKDNSQRFLVGTTLWGAVHAFSSDANTTDIDAVIDAVVAAGFDYIQGPIPIDGAFPAPVKDDVTHLRTIAGHAPFTTLTASSVVLNESYWTHIDYFVQKATDEGLYVIMPVMWGSMVDQVFSQSSNFLVYAQAVVQRYASNPKIVWMGVGEYTKYAWQTAPNDDNTLSEAELTTLTSLADIIRTYAHPDSLITFHPDGWKSSSEHWHANENIDFHMLQSAASHNQNIIDIAADRALTNHKPVIQSEMAYEGGAETAWDVRMGAYHAFLGGAAAFTYGHDVMWTFTNSDPANGFSDPGHLDITDVFLPFVREHHGTDGVTPDRTIIKAGGGSSADNQNTYLSTARTEAGAILAYASKGDTFSLDITGAGGGLLSYKWINPRTGAEEGASTVEAASNVQFNPPGAPAVDNDYLLVISAGGAPVTNIAEGASTDNYFLSCETGNDNNNGRTAATAWRTPAKANSSLTQQGGDLYLNVQEDCTQGELIVDWGGTAQNRAEVSGYWLSGGQPKHWTPGVKLARIRGSYRMDGCRATDPSTCPWGLTNTTGAIPSNHFRALLGIYSPYVRAYGLHISDAAGNGLAVFENDSMQSFFIGEYMTISGTTARAVQVSKAVAGGNAYFREIAVSDCALVTVDGLHPIWPSCISFDSNDSTVNSGILFEYNRVERSGGEGIGTLRIGGVHVRRNYMASARHVLYYADASSNILMEDNVGVGGPSFGNLTGWPGLFAAGVECYVDTQHAEGIIFRNNIGLNIGSPMWVFVERTNGCPANAQHRDPAAEGFRVGVDIVGNYIRFNTDRTTRALDAYNTHINNNIARLYVQNNIFDGANSCSINAATANTNISNNGWASAPSGLCGGTGDQTGTLGVANDATWDYANPPDLTLFDGLPGGSPFLNTGITRNDTLIIPNLYSGRTSDTCGITEAQFRQGNYRGTDCAVHDGTPNIGPWAASP